MKKGYVLLVITVFLASTVAVKAISGNCSVGAWKGIDNYKARDSKPLATVPKADAEKKCKEACFNSIKCVSLDTVHTENGTLCYASMENGYVERNQQAVHWEYEVKCKSTTGHVFRFKYAGPYYIEPTMSIRTSKASDLQHCLGQCAFKTLGCRLVFYGEGVCYRALLGKIAYKPVLLKPGYHMFEKDVGSYSSIYLTLISRYLHRRPEKGSITEDHCKQVMYQTYTTAQVCWSKKANKACIFLVAHSHHFRINYMFVKMKANRIECIIKCIELKVCRGTAYKDGSCYMSLSRMMTGASRTTSEFTLYYKKVCSN